MTATFPLFSCFVWRAWSPGTGARLCSDALCTAWRHQVCTGLVISREEAETSEVIFTFAGPLAVQGGSSIVWSPLGLFFFFFLHGLISVFLLLGKRVKHEKLVFTILAHPVQNKALFKGVPFSSLTVLWMPPSSAGPNHPPLHSFKLSIYSLRS